MCACVCVRAHAPRTLKGREVLFVVTCFFILPSTGPGVLDYTLHTEEHKCKKDALLSRMKHSLDKKWKLIRPRPTKTQYVGPYYICKGNARLVFVRREFQLCFWLFLCTFLPLIGQRVTVVVSEVAVGEECLYPGHCTFAYCQEEIDVWTLERKGFISRELLFDPFGPNSNIRLTVPKILQEHRGIFMFLCGVSPLFVV